MNILNLQDALFILKSHNFQNSITVFISGVTGQDGSHLSDYLLKNENCIVIGGIRRLSVENHKNIRHLENHPRFIPVNFDLTDANLISNTIKTLKPDYFVNLAAQAFVGSSWDMPLQTWETNATSTLNILESIRQHHPKCRFYNAGSSEEYGNVIYSPQDENHPLRPRSPYGASKAASRHIVKVYRESYGLYAIQGLLFNHEGTRRGIEFVTRKITTGVARIHRAISDNIEFEPIQLGNIYAKRDWSDAEDFVVGIWMMLNQDRYNSSLKTIEKEHLHRHIKEYVLSSDETHSIKEFVEKSFAYAGIEGAWHGTGTNEQFSITEKFADERNPKSSILVKIDPKFYRPAEVDTLQGTSIPARTELKWQPNTSFDELVKKMVLNDLKS